MKPLSTLERAILHAVAQLGPDSYGVPIRRLVEHQTERMTSIGALYIVLDRLERKGYVTSRPGEATPQRSGRPKRHFAITQTGQDML